MTKAIIRPKSHHLDFNKYLFEIDVYENETIETILYKLGEKFEMNASGLPIELEQLSINGYNIDDVLIKSTTYPNKIEAKAGDYPRNKYKNKNDSVIKLELNRINYHNVFLDTPEIGSIPIIPYSRDLKSRPGTIKLGKKIVNKLREYSFMNLHKNGFAFEPLVPHSKSMGVNEWIVNKKIINIFQGAIIGPKGTPYEGGLIFLLLQYNIHDKLHVRFFNNFCEDWDELIHDYQNIQNTYVNYIIYKSNDKKYVYNTIPAPHHPMIKRNGVVLNNFSFHGSYEKTKCMYEMHLMIQLLRDMLSISYSGDNDGRDGDNKGDSDKVDGDNKGDSDKVDGDNKDENKGDDNKSNDHGDIKVNKPRELFLRHDRVSDRPKYWTKDEDRKARQITSGYHYMGQFDYEVMHYEQIKSILIKVSFSLHIPKDVINIIIIYLESIVAKHRITPRDFYMGRKVVI